MTNTPIEDIRERLHQLEAEMAGEVEQLIARKREQFQYTVRAGRVRFDKSMSALHRRHRKGTLAYVRNAPIGYLLTAPITYGLLIPLLFLDVSIMLFQQVCFRVYGVPLVARRDYLTFDRQLLDYLNVIEKINCVFCSYSNGFFAYAREVAARTEQYWCPIKHAMRTKDAHPRAEDFFDYGDAETYQADLSLIRVKLLDR